MQSLWWLWGALFMGNSVFEVSNATHSAGYASMEDYIISLTVTVELTCLQCNVYRQLLIHQHQPPVFLLLLYVVAYSHIKGTG